MSVLNIVKVPKCEVNVCINAPSKSKARASADQTAHSGLIGGGGGLKETGAKMKTYKLHKESVLNK